MSTVRENDRERRPEITDGDVVPPLAQEIPMPADPLDIDPLEEDIPPVAGLGGALSVLRRGLRESPEMRVGIGFTIALAFADTVGRLLVPILIQLVIDRGINGPDGFRPGFVYTACAIAAVAVVLIYFAGRATYRRLIRASESALSELRIRAFTHIHELSIAAQNEQKRGAFVARVTADIETIAQFLEWGGISWILGPSLMLGTIVMMLVYSWQLTLVLLGVIAPLYLVMRRMQKGMARAYDDVRTAVGDTMSEVSESIMGAAVVRAYGLQERMDRRLTRAIARQYRAQMAAAKYQATIFPMGDLFGSAALAAVVAIGVTLGPGWGLSVGKLVAVLFLITIFLGPLAELSETFDLTQTAVAGWRKVLGVIDLPVDVVEPQPGLELPAGPLAVRTEALRFAYGENELVLRGIDVDLEEGSHVAVVGETGCGKTTFAKLLCRLADPTEGRILLEGIDLREVSASSRRKAVRMVPQDGFLFDTTIRENVRFGREGATDADIHAAFDSLGLREWVDRLPERLETEVGQRGESLSVGERQFVALTRAQLAGPGLLILDEATSAVDPESERALAEALERLSEGRTTLTIAHRLSTAEGADLVLVFDRGRVVERGAHKELIDAGGVYAGLYESWLGNTRADRGSGEPR
ncbi:MAG: ABC transporter ATP-binding protein/permease [Actinomycetota bacterium]|nr:ABC transporter ATP-binding protein/permease [Actinomycetota bacterium]